MKDLINFIVTNIVNHKDKVNVSEAPPTNDNRKTYTIAVDKEDMGIVIGKQGKTINSIRNIAKSKSIKDNTFINIQIQES